MVKVDSSNKIPVSEAAPLKNAQSDNKANESDINIKNNINKQMDRSLTSKGLNDDSTSSIYDPRKSMITDFNDEEHARKGKNVVDKFKNSLPSSVFKKREFVIDKSKTMSTDKGNLS